MTVTKFDILNPVINLKKPFYSSNKGIFFIPIKHNYKFFVECTRLNNLGETEYYILFNTYKFDENCRICHTDNYGRVQIRPLGEMKEFIERETLERGNINCEYQSSEEDYDIYKVY